MSFGATLIELRTELGFSSAKKFHSHCVKHGLSLNYSYYMKIESGELPSNKVVQELVKIAPVSWKEALVLTFCQMQFSEFTYLFESPLKNNSKDLKSNIDSQEFKKHEKNELSIKQITAIAEDESIYHLFLLLTLARKPILKKELEIYFSKQKLIKSISILEQAKLIITENEYIKTISIERTFPMAQNEQLIEIYKIFDKWDSSFGTKFQLEPIVTMNQLRRISPRYLTLIKKQLDLLFDLIRASDESDLRHNSKVLQLSLSLKEGSLPG